MAKVALITFENYKNSMWEKVEVDRINKRKRTISSTNAFEKPQHPIVNRQKINKIINANQTVLISNYFKLVNNFISFYPYIHKINVNLPPIKQHSASQTKNKISHNTITQYSGSNRQHCISTTIQWQAR